MEDETEKISEGGGKTRGKEIGYEGSRMVGVTVQLSYKWHS